MYDGVSGVLRPGWGGCVYLDVYIASVPECMGRRWAVASGGRATAELLTWSLRVLRIQLLCVQIERRGAPICVAGQRRALPIRERVAVQFAYMQNGEVLVCCKIPSLQVLKALLIVVLSRSNVIDIQ